MPPRKRKPKPATLTVEKARAVLERSITKHQPERLAAFLRYIEDERLADLATVREQLLDAIRARGERLTAMARGAGIPQPVLARFVSGERRDLKLSTIDKLAAYLGLRLTATEKETKP